MPMIVRQSRTPLTRCPTASHQPKKMIQSTFPITDATPARGAG